MKIGTVVRIIIISIIFTSVLVVGIKKAAEREAAGAPAIADLHF